MTLRDRSKKASNQSASESGTPPPKSQSTTPGGGARRGAADTPAQDLEADNVVTQKKVVPVVETEEARKKKLPRVLLRVNPPTLD